MTPPPSKPHPEMDALIAKAKAMPPMTPAELQAQRISFAFGNLPEGSTMTREDVAALDYAKYGNLAELTAQIAEANARADAAERRASARLEHWRIKPVASAPEDIAILVAPEHASADDWQVSWLISSEGRWANWNRSTPPYEWAPMPLRHGMGGDE